MSFIRYALLALVVSFGVEAVDQTNHNAAVALAVIIVLSVLIARHEAVDELRAIVGV